MRPFLLLVCLTFSLSAFGFDHSVKPKAKGKPHATCTGIKSCRACKNCKYCGHCAKQGGSCGVYR